jgi:hypothetical protein
VIGASDNETGNQKYGGDWILENTREDIVSVYFTGAIVTDFKGTLASTISTTRTIDAAYLQTTSNWPITIQGGTSGSPVVVTITEDATIPASVGDNGYFIINSEYIIIDGGNKTLTIAYTGGYSGLVENGTSGAAGKSNVTIRNINVATASSSVVIASNGGWIGRIYFGRGTTLNTISNCTSSGIISGSAAGGIVGQHAGSTNGQVTISNCSSSGIISGSAAGGIVGQQAGNTNGQVTISNCSSSGIISGSFSGGISGIFFGYNTSTLKPCTIENCYSTGTMTGLYSGGICGGLVGYSNNASYTAQIQISNCFSWGSFSSDSGGICGGGSNIYTTIPIVSISNCYILQSGDIVSPVFSIATSISITGCYIASGNWSDSSASSFLSDPTVWSSLSPGTPYVLVSNPTPSSSFPVNKIISSSTTLSTTDLQTLSNWPIQINGGTSSSNPVVVTITGDATLTDIQCFFVMNGNYATIEGGEKTMTVTATEYPGLVRTVGYSDTTVRNINVNGITQLSISSGWIGQQYYGSGTINNKIENCTSSGMIVNSAGGIIGTRAGYNNGQVTISNCTSSGIINGTYGGGIMGAYAGNINGQVTISNCTSSGIISGSGAGGIVGLFFGYNTNQLCKIENCYSTGNITFTTGFKPGGISGAQIGYNDSSSPSYTPIIQISNCYVWGSIASGCGGICGGTNNSTYTNTPSVTISNCYLKQSGDLVASNLQIKSSIITSNTYIANGTWSDTAATASGALIGVPSSFPGIGSIWTSTLANTPFLFSVSIPCLCRNMMILTPSGYVPIECLKEGDLLLAPPFYNRTVEIRRVFSSTYVGTKENVPYRIPAHFFERNKPSEDILLSPHHLVFYNGKWHLPCQIEGVRAEESMIGERFEYYHIALPEYYSDKIWCNNMAVDSWDDSDLNMDPMEKEKEASTTSLMIEDRNQETQMKILMV